MKNLDIILACSDLGVTIDGSNLGPEKILENISLEQINNIKKIYKNNNYIKSLDKNDKKKNLNEINCFNSNLYTAVADSIKNNYFPLILGGDHSIAIGSALASINQNSNLGIIWFDAHGDFNTFETTVTGNIHGLPFAAITNYEKNLLTSFHNLNYFNCKNAVLLGARDIDKPYELENLQKAGVTIITTEDIQKYGIKKMSEKAFEIASAGTNGIHISYDLDVLDPSVAPGVSVPVPNGLSEKEAFDFLDYLLKNKNKFKSFDLVEFNPIFDINGKTENIALKIINKIINAF